MTDNRKRAEEFEEFVRRDGEKLLRGAFLLTGDHPTAEDVCQTALMRTLSHWRKARRSPRAYANRVLVNLVRDRWRSAARSESVELNAFADEKLTEMSGADVEVVVDRDAVLRGLRSLSPDQRTVIVLRYFGDMRVADVAQTLGLPEGTVKSLASRGLARLHRIVVLDSRPTRGGTPCRPLNTKRGPESG